MDLTSQHNTLGDILTGSSADTDKKEAWNVEFASSSFIIVPDHDDKVSGGCMVGFYYYIRRSAIKLPVIFMNFL